MERKNLIFILSGLLLANFFVPFIEWGDFSMSGFDFVVSSNTPVIKYIMLAVPGCALFLMIGVLIDSTWLMYSKWLLRIPLFTMVLLLILLFSNSGSRAALNFENPFKIFELGFWIALTVSSLLTIMIRNRNAQRKVWDLN